MRHFAKQSRPIHLIRRAAVALIAASTAVYAFAAAAPTPAARRYAEPESGVVQSCLAEADAFATAVSRLVAAGFSHVEIAWLLRIRMERTDPALYRLYQQYLATLLAAQAAARSPGADTAVWMERAEDLLSRIAGLCVARATPTVEEYRISF